MSNQLIESILNKDFVLAENHFRDRLETIKEQKLYELKRMIAAQLDEVMGALTKDEIEDRRRRGYLKAADVLGDPMKSKLPFLGRKPEEAKAKSTKKVKSKKKSSNAKSNAKLKAHVKKIKVKHLKEIAVQPDPEGRVAGGSSKPMKQKENPLMRKLAAKAIKIGKKVGGAEFRKGYFATKKELGTEKPKDTDVRVKRKAPPTSTTPKKDDEDNKPKNSWVRRNVNTFMDRSPDENAKPSRGGRLGKAVGGVLTGLSGYGSMNEQSKI